ncbi:MAG TPA: serine/threonine-protein kinase, partial [Bryobacteraceae bacterium]|nr:serine/threonine-protein kinase [Bryobacteraceae bacterium]
MSAQRPPWPDIEKLFFAALDIPAAERDDWLDRAADGQPDLAGEVRSLLQAHADSEAAQAPRHVGPYRLERLISRGGMGEVWQAARADGEFEQRVALKLVRSGMGVDLLLPRFRRERQLLARLDHPHIARLLDGGVSSDGRPYLAMEYVEGEPILDFCERRTLGIAPRLELFRKLCSAVEYAHQHLIVHRDIKPGNVLVTPGPEGHGVPKLLDFGIAKLVESDTAAAATAFPLLTPRYASPEQLRGEDVTTASDVYSLGVLLFELLTGSLPYQLHGTTPAEVVTAIATREPRVASQVKRGNARPVPAGDLDAILAKALEKDPARRYGSADRLATDIGNYLEGLPVAARAPARLYRFRKYVRRHRIGVLAAAAVALSLIAATAVSVRAADIANRQRRRAERVTAFLGEVLNSPDSGVFQLGLGMGRDVRMIDLLNAASRRIGPAFADDPGLEARLHRVLAATYLNLDLLPAGDREIQAALARIGALSDNPLEKALLLEIAGELDQWQRRLEPAEQHMRQALDIFDHSPQARADVVRHAEVLDNFAVLLIWRGKQPEAEQCVLRAARLVENVPAARPLMGLIQSNLAYFDLVHGDLKKGEADAAAAVEKLSSVPHPPVQLVYAEMNLGAAKRYLGQPDAAMAAFERALQAALPAGGPDYPVALSARIELAYQRAVAGRAREAEADLSRCLELARKPEGQVELDRALHALGYVKTLAGRPREGEPLLRQSLDLRLKSHPLADYRVAQIRLELGECLERQHRI